MVICEAHFCSNSGSITKRCNKADGYFVARPKGSTQIAHSCVITFDKDWAIVCKSRLAVNNLGNS
jgi:hypothetical protein